MSELPADVVKEIGKIIDNVQIVSPSVVRGAQPDREGLQLLQKAGVKMIVNLRYAAKSAPAATGSFFLHNRGDDDEIDEEREICTTLGMKFINISLNGYTTPDIADLERFVSLFADKENLPVYVHCLYGKERTGLMLAAYRVKVESWTVEEAYKEMLANGFDPLRTVLSDALFKFVDKTK